MTQDRCPRCGCQGFENLKTHSYCPQCNFGPELEGDSDDAVIPRWVTKHLSLTKEELTDINEINSGMYRAGYEMVVRRDPVQEPRVEEAKPVLRKISRRRKPTTFGRSGRNLHDPNPFLTENASHLS